MDLYKSGLSAIVKLAIAAALAITFMIGLFGVVYLQLRGEEITIPKITGKNFNVGKEELKQNGLKIKRIARRYSNEDPDTILEQRPKAGTIAKTGLMISVIVSEENPDGSEAPTGVKNDEESIEEIESLPELKTEKSKKKSKSKSKKVESKTRDIVKKKDKTQTKDGKKDKKASKPGDVLAGGENDANSKDSKSKATKKDAKKASKPKKEKTTQPKKDRKPKTGSGNRKNQLQ